MTRTSSRDQLALAALVVVVPMVVLALTGLVGSLAWWMPLLVAGLVVTTLNRQDRYGDSLLLVSVVLVWVVGGTADHPFATLGVALLALALHGSLAMRASAPRAARFDRVIRGRWLARFAVLSAVTAAGWAVTWALQGADLPSSGVAVLVALLVCTGFALMVRWLLRQSMPGDDARWR